MPGTPTPHFDLIQPTVGGDSGAWGGELNTNNTTIDTALFNIQATANAAVASTGDNMTGRLDVQTETIPMNPISGGAGAVTFDLTQSSYIAMTVTGAITGITVTLPSGTLPTYTWADVLLLRITNGGAFAITWPATFKFPGGTAPALTASGTDLIGWIYDSGSGNFYMAGVQLNLR